jgi:quinol monooxygenase YgiN
MAMERRTFVTMVAIGMLPGARGVSSAQETTDMYGRIGKITAVAGQRDALIEVLLEGITNMPGCRSYVVAKDITDSDGIWITEVWDSEASHKASLALPAVRAAIAKGRPLIAGFGSSVVTTPIGGHGLGDSS